jgi:hypothetical protein
MPDDKEAALPESGAPETFTDSFRANAGDIFGRLFRGVAFDRALSMVLAIAVQAEQAVSEVIAIQLGRDEECIEILAEEVFGHVPHDKKLKLLERMIATRSWADEFPKVVPTLRRLYELRNQLAHSYSAEEPGARSNDAIYRRRTYWRGREKDLNVDADEVLTLTEAVDQILSELAAAALGVPPACLTTSPTAVRSTSPETLTSSAVHSR